MNPELLNALERRVQMVQGRPIEVDAATLLALIHAARRVVPLELKRHANPADWRDE